MYCDQFKAAEPAGFQQTPMSDPEQQPLLDEDAAKRKSTVTLMRERVGKVLENAWFHRFVIALVS